jgi:hypothetical protein
MAAAWACWTSPAFGKDYLLRLEVVGDRDQAPTVETPRETVDRRIEVIARPGAPFHTKVKLGAQTLTFRGELRAPKCKHFPVEFHYHHVTQIEPTDGAEPEPRHTLRDEIKLFTTVNLELGVPKTVSHLKARRESPGQPARRSESRIVLRLTRYKADAD